ncbi:solute carrier family 10 member 6 [Trichonephila inaurata madagascariensis]|uniref:Solute carrier family 10 member 6 n=1 Tax=Trichonephila inaurata madagascariensis TaxID=2747483 RepID=A0A8X7C3P6_9ARAC|nr:solute carrier family 10 member 6 [Trichonephila inaurata madagascariensis]
MTCASTVMALCMMPANIWLYGRSFNSENLVIPYQKMALSLISVTSPVIAGMTLKWKFPKAASVVSKLGSYCGVLIMFFCIVIEVVVFPNMFTGIPLKLYAVILTLPLIGLSLGFSLATLLQQRIQIRKTISIECGVQNVPIALTIIAMSFPLKVQEEIVLLPWLYGFAMMTACSIISFSFCVEDAEEEDLTNWKALRLQRHISATMKDNRDSRL